MKHAKFSASGSERWLKCPGSINAEENYENTTSKYALEGQYAHTLAEYCLKYQINPLNMIGKQFEGDTVTEEMGYYVSDYYNLIFSEYSPNQQDVLLVEKTVDFSNIAPEAFGTLDAAIINIGKTKVKIFDLKYGKGVRVDAENNSQAMMYCLGLLNEFEDLIKIEEFEIYLVQPRLNNISKWNISIKDLVDFGNYASERAKLALTDNAPRIPGDKQCRFCKAKGDCKDLYEFTNRILNNDFQNLEEKDPNSLTYDQKKLILDNQDLIESFMKSVSKSVYQDILNGDNFEGYKLVKSRRNRTWREDAVQELSENFPEENLFEKKLISIGKAEKKLGKDVIKDYVYKPEGDLTLVKSEDKRESVSIIIDNDFEKIEI